MEFDVSDGEITIPVNAGSSNHAITIVSATEEYTAGTFEIYPSPYAESVSSITLAIEDANGDLQNSIDATAIGPLAGQSDAQGQLVAWYGPTAFVKIVANGVTPATGTVLVSYWASQGGP